MDTLRPVIPLQHFATELRRIADDGQSVHLDGQERGHKNTRVAVFPGGKKDEEERVREKRREMRGKSILIQA